MKIIGTKDVMANEELGIDLLKVRLEKKLGERRNRGMMYFHVLNKVLEYLGMYVKGGQKPEWMVVKGDESDLLWIFSIEKQRVICCKLVGTNRG